MADTFSTDLALVGVEWAVPAFALVVPALILIVALAAQALVGGVWIAYSRRRLRGLGVRAASRP